MMRRISSVKYLLRISVMCLWMFLVWRCVRELLLQSDRMESADLEEYIVNKDYLEECITKDAKPPRTMPRIIHQVWDGHHVPAIYHPWIRSVVEKNPEFEYWFWTLGDVRRLIQTRFRSHLHMFDTYDANIYRTDVMRYYVISTFGGIYLDLDVQCLRPLLPWAERYGCFMSEETHEHAYLLSKSPTPGVMTTVLGCVPTHPFYTQVINALPQFSRIYPKNVLRATGPGFLEGQYRKYVTSLGNTSSSRVTSSQGIPPSKSSCGQNNVAVVNYKLFLPTYDVTLREQMKSICVLGVNLPPGGDSLCQTNFAKDWHSAPSGESYTNHFWLHVNLRSSEWKLRDTRHIRDMVSSVRNVSGIVDSLT